MKDLTMLILALLTVLIGAVGYRVRGTGLWRYVRGNRAAKLAIGSVGVALGCYLVGVPLWAAASVWLLTATLDGITPGHGEGMDLGRMSGTVSNDAVLLLGNGLVSMLPAFLALLLIGHHPIAATLAGAGGLAKPAAYALGWICPIRLPAWCHVLPRSTEWGEVITGLFRTLFVLAVAV
jgi:hypothetical protein